MFADVLAHVWRCILGRTLPGRIMRFPLVFLDIPSDCTSESAYPDNLYW